MRFFFLYIISCGSSFAEVLAVVNLRNWYREVRVCTSGLERRRSTSASLGIVSGVDIIGEKFNN